MSKDYSHWADIRDNYFKTMQLAEAEVQIIRKKYFDKWNIADVGTVSKEQFDECNKEIQAIYDKYKIQIDWEGKPLNQNKEDENLLTKKQTKQRSNIWCVGRKQKLGLSR